MKYVPDRHPRGSRNPPMEPEQYARLVEISDFIKDAPDDGRFYIRGFKHWFALSVSSVMLDGLCSSTFLNTDTLFDGLDSASFQVMLDGLNSSTFQNAGTLFDGLNSVSI